MSADSGEATNNKFHAYQLLYDNKQQWIRHYETLLAQITPLSTTGALGIIAYVADKDMDRLFLAAPAMIIGFNIWFICWCNRELRSSFMQLVQTEEVLGLYKLNESGKKPVLPEAYQKSGETIRPIIWAGFTLQFVSSIAWLAVLFKWNS